MLSTQQLQLCLSGLYVLVPVLGTTRHMKHCTVYRALFYCLVETEENSGYISFVSTWVNINPGARSYLQSRAFLENYIL